MAAVSIQLPNIEAEHTVEITVKVNGVQKDYQYRVEVLPWEQCDSPTGDRVACIRKVVESYDPEYELLQIGTATEQYIQITFQRVRQQRYEQLIAPGASA